MSLSLSVLRSKCDQLFISILDVNGVLVERIDESSGVRAQEELDLISILQKLSLFLQRYGHVLVRLSDKPHYVSKNLEPSIVEMHMKNCLAAKAQAKRRLSRCWNRVIHYGLHFAGGKVHRVYDA
jgi:hypothetical protein